jgi:D-alanyl-lipoteichoic acid acyltransferase DltB (MBOAT superfamily)
VRTYVNVLIVFLISGLWHGASWMFLIWGAIHGFYQLYEKATYNIRDRLWKLIKLDGTWMQWTVKWFVTMSVVLISWVFFRASNTDEALMILQKIINIDMINGQALSTAVSLTRIRFGRMIVTSVSILILLMSELVSSRNKNSTSTKFMKIYLLLIWILLFGEFGLNEFIYFQF